MRKLKNNFWFILSALVSILVLVLSLRGLPGNPTSTQLNTPAWIEQGPFELSPERGRFALLYSLIEDHSVRLSLPLARFSVPDVGYFQGHYVSLFDPGVSFIAVPGYLAGRWLGVSQVGSFATIALFALFNAWLIRAIAMKLGADKLMATLAGIVFLFATPAFTYAVTLYQHHISTFLVLLSIYRLLKAENLRTLALVWFLFAVSVIIDYPNVFLMAPIILYLTSRILIIKPQKSGLRVNLRLTPVPTLLAILLPLGFLLWFNQASYNNPWQLSGTVKTVRDIKTETYQTTESDVLITDIDRYRLAGVNETQTKQPLRFFNTRDLLNGLTIHFLSPDRGMIFYTPVIFLGILGIREAVKRRLKMTAVMLSIISLNVLVYSLWGDPWGGWAFGSRYLIPSYALMAVFIAIFLSNMAKNLLLSALFLTLFVYSVSVNTTGAITTSSLPPKVEVLALEQQTKRPQEYTYQKNFDYLQTDHAKAYVFRAFADRFLTATQYDLIITALIIGLGTTLMARYLAKGKADG